MKQDREPMTPATDIEVQIVPKAGTPRPPRRRRAVLGLLAAVVIAAGGYEGYRWWTNGRFMVATNDAYVQADITLISSRVQGYVKALPVAANAHVAAGEVILRLDDGDYRIALQSAQSKVATMDQTLARIDAQTAAAQAAVAQAAAGRDAAQAQLTNADATLERVQGLVDRKVVPQAQLDAATEAQATAVAGLAKAKAAVQSAQAQIGVLEAQRAEAEGQRHELTLAVAQAQRNLDLTVLRAPVAGTVTNFAVKAGDLVQPGARLAALVPDGGLYVEANFKETQMQGVEPGAKVEISFDALPGKTYQTTVTSAAPATGSVFSLIPADNATGNFTKIVQRVPVRIAVPPQALATGELRAGLSAEVSVDSRTGSADTRLARN